MSNRSSVDSLTKKMEDLESQAKSVKELRDLLYEGAGKQAEKRDSLNSEHKRVRGEIAHYKAERDLINQKVSELKKERINVRSEIEAKQKQYGQTREKVRLLLTRAPMNKDETERQITALDWEIQTSSLTKTEENSIINQIKLLEQQHQVQKEALNLSEKASTSRAEITALQNHSDNLRERILELVEQSQGYHTRMLEKIKEAEEIKDKADKNHQEFIKLKEEANMNNEKYSELIKQINEVSGAIAVFEENTRRKRESEVIDAQAENASRKLKERKKLTFEEFQALVKRGRI